MQTRSTTWEAVLDDFAQKSGRSVKRRWFRWRRTVTVPPDDAISVELATVNDGSTVNGMKLSERLVLRTNIGGNVTARVHIRDRNPPGVIKTFGAEPVVYDDPRHDWVAESSNTDTARSLLTPDVIGSLDQCWLPTSWADVNNHKGGVRVIVGEQRSEASPQRLDQLISLMRQLTGAVQR